MKIDWIKRFLTMSLALSAILAHRPLGLNAMAIRLGLTRTSTAETRDDPDSVFQESWLYTLADV
jgi:hypothetical protein